MVRRKFFGVDVAREIRNATRGQLRPTVLHSRQEAAASPSNLAAGPVVTFVDHEAEGLTASRRIKRSDTNTAETVEVVLLIADSITPFVVPKMGDYVSVDGGEEFEVDMVTRDPAEATYTLLLV